MSALRCLASSVGKTLIARASSRCITTSSVTRLKEIRESKEGRNLIIGGVIVPEPKQHLQIARENKQSCLVCATGLDVKHTDVLILSQFVRSDGCMLPRRITGLCKKQQKQIGTMVTMAQKAGLMPNIAPANSKKNPKTRRDWRKFNTYFDESTIKISKYLM